MIGGRGRSLALAAVVAAAVLAAGCGGEDDPVAAWADDACGLLSDWRASVDEAVGSVASSPSRESVSGAVDDVLDATKTLTVDLRDLGAPPTQAAEQTGAALDELTSSLDDRREAVDLVVENGVDSLAEAQNAAAILLREFERAAADVRTFVEAAADPGSGAQEVADAIRESDACDDLRSAL